MSDEEITKSFEPDEIVRKTVNSNGQIYLGRHLDGRDVVVAYQALGEEAAASDREDANR